MLDLFFNGLEILVGITTTILFLGMFDFIKESGMFKAERQEELKMIYIKGNETFIIERPATDYTINEIEQIITEYKLSKINNKKKE